MAYLKLAGGGLKCLGELTWIVTQAHVTAYRPVTLKKSSKSPSHEYSF